MTFNCEEKAPFDIADQGEITTLEYRCVCENCQRESAPGEDERKALGAAILAGWKFTSLEIDGETIAYCGLSLCPRCSLEW